MDKKHLYNNSNHTVVAHSLEEAKANWDEWTFTEKSQGFDDDEWEEEHLIWQLDDDKLFTLYCEDELKNQPNGVVIDGPKWTATAGAWAESMPVGYFASTEY